MNRYLYFVCSFFAIIGSIFVAIVIKDFALASVQKHGTLVDGSFRDIKVGMHRNDVAGKFLGQSRLKIVGYQFDGQDSCVLGFEHAGCSDLRTADSYHFRYSSWFYESISVRFDGDVVESIDFSRRLIYLDP
jgi:hypothetical protein